MRIVRSRELCLRLKCMRANGFELSGRGTPDRQLFYPLTSYNIASKSRSIPGPFQRVDYMKALHLKLHW